jgi:hypothetical protein
MLIYITFALTKTSWNINSSLTEDGLRVCNFQCFKRTLFLETFLSIIRFPNKSISSKVTKGERWTIFAYKFLVVNNYVYS